MKHDIVTLDNKKIDSVDLLDSVFGVELNKHVVNQVIHWQRACAQAGTHHSKGISEVQGTTRKPWRQKGTGRARQGSLRSPQFRGGAIIHGPVSRSHAYALPKKIRSLALRMVLSEKLRQGNVIVLENLDMKQASTKQFTDSAVKLKIQSALFVGTDAPINNLSMSARNLSNFQYLPTVGFNVYDALKYDTLALTKDALAALQERLA